MADNVTVDNGTLTDYDTATDDVGGVHFQRIKLDVGGNGASTPVEWYGGRLPVEITDGSNIAAITGGGGLITALSDSAGNSIESYVGSVEGDGSSQASKQYLQTQSLPFVYNGATWDRLRGDTLGVHVSRAATAATATLTNVNDTATSTTLLAANTSRKGASIHNDSTAVLYVKFGTTASATSFTVKMAADAHYEVPFGYTGRIDGIWASDASGAARITELT